MPLTSSTLPYLQEEETLTTGSQYMAFVRRFYAVKHLTPYTLPQSSSNSFFCLFQNVFFGILSGLFVPPSTLPVDGLFITWSLTQAYAFIVLWFFTLSLRAENLNAPCSKLDCLFPKSPTPPRDVIGGD